VKRFEVTTTALDDGGHALLCPAVGYVLGLPAPGHVLMGGEVLAQLEVLGVRHALTVPASVRGRVAAGAGAGAPLYSAAYGDELLRLEALGDVHDAHGERDADNARSTGPTLRAPMTGRFYVRPGPDKAPFVSVGDILEAGHTVGLLEVMKTFSRVLYEGAALPARARVLNIVPADGDDVEEGAPLLEFEAAD